MQVRIKKCYADCISISNEKGTEIRPLDIGADFGTVLGYYGEFIYPHIRLAIKVVDSSNRSSRNLK